MRVALGSHWGAYRLATNTHWGRIEVALGTHWGGLFQHVSISAFQRFSVSVLCLLLFFGCSPSLDDAKQALQQRITFQSEGRIKLVSFAVTEVQEFQAAGVQKRRIVYAAQIEFEENGLWSRGVGSGSLNFEFRPNPRTADGKSTYNPRAANEVAAQMMKDLQGERQMSKGDCEKIVGTMTGSKLESGWKYELNGSHTTD
jgi:hypothetical protein